MESFPSQSICEPSIGEDWIQSLLMLPCRYQLCIDSEKREPCSSSSHNWGSRGSRKYGSGIESSKFSCKHMDGLNLILYVIGPVEIGGEIDIGDHQTSNEEEGRALDEQYSTLGHRDLVV